MTEHESRGDSLAAPVEYRLKTPFRQKSNTVTMIKGWVRRRPSMEDGINEARALFGGNIDEVDFDGCYVSVKLDGQTKFVRPDSYSDLYTYDNGDSQRMTDPYFAKVNEKLAALGLATSMDLDLTRWPTGLPDLGETQATT